MQVEEGQKDNRFPFVPRYLKTPELPPMQEFGQRFKRFYRGGWCRRSQPLRDARNASCNVLQLGGENTPR
jgi:hypothetical protein